MYDADQCETSDVKLTTVTKKTFSSDSTAKPTLEYYLPMCSKIAVSEKNLTCVLLMVVFDFAYT